MVEAVSAAATEAAVEASTMGILQDALEGASLRTVGLPFVEVWRLPKECVRPARQADMGADLSCHAPATLWKRLRARSSDDEGVRLSTVSEYGLEKEVLYKDAPQLADAIVASLDSEARRFAADVRSKSDGTLQITTQLHMRRQRVAGRLHCTTCGQARVHAIPFLLGERGLRDHQQVKHGNSYEIAKEAVTAARGALVAYAPLQGVGAELSRLWAARVAATEHARHALPAGLAAARDGDLDALRQLASSGDFDAHSTVDRHGSSALHFAAGGGHVEMCSYLVDELGVRLAQAQQADGRTALHWAARNGHLSVCRWLVGRGADPNAGTNDGTRPLHWAVWQGHLTVVAWLVDEAGADLHALNSYGCNAIQWAAQSDQTHGLETCRWLHRRGLDLALLNRNGHSALHKAAVKGRTAVCEWLLSAEVGLGARQLQPDGDGNTPSIMARLEGHMALADLLLEAERQRPADAVQPSAARSEEARQITSQDEQTAAP